MDERPCSVLGCPNWADLTSLMDGRLFWLCPEHQGEKWMFSVGDDGTLTATDMEG
jgi:hypothetical protein